jgi:putative transposase
MSLINTRRACVPVSKACEWLHFSKATYYRLKQGPKKSVRRQSVRCLRPDERQSVLDLFHEDRFLDLPPGQVYARLLDEGRYIASERTMYRILAANNEVKERRRLRRHPKYTKPELLATGPNQLWSWDLTRLRGPNKLEYYHLYVMLDVYSRYVVGWMLAYKESAELAKNFIEETCKSQGISRNNLTIHADRGPSMKSKTVADLYAHLGVSKSHSRPRVSNDNPYSESQFKTMKYCLTYPDRFGSIEDASSFCRDFFNWYNYEHYHSGIKMLTPANVHSGEGERILLCRANTKLMAFERHQERFVKGPPKPEKLEHEVWINPPKARGANFYSENQEVKSIKAHKTKK